MKNKFIDKIKSKDILVGVVGLGYVGLPLAVEIAKSNFEVIGFDIEEKKVNFINDGVNYIKDIKNEEFIYVIKNGYLKATNDFSKISKLDFIIVCVPTPLDKYGQPNITYIENSICEIAKYMKKETVVVLESTTFPGTTEEIVKPILENGTGFKCNLDFYLGFSPERIDPGNNLYKTKNTPKVIGAIGKDASDVIEKMYKSFLESEIKIVSSPKVAEMEKILENTYRNINIGLINELTIVCNEMGINIWEVIDAAKTKPYGFQVFYPGPGIGGHCIPLDPTYLLWKVKEFGMNINMIETSNNINSKMPKYCIERIYKILNKLKKSINGSKILILGIAYKRDIDDFRESPALDIINELRKNGAIVDFYDKWINKYNVGKDIYIGLNDLNENNIKEYDLIVITTDHSNIDYKLIQKNAKMIFDTRNAMKDIKNRENIELL